MADPSESPDTKVRVDVGRDLSAEIPGLRPRYRTRHQYEECDDVPYRDEVSNGQGWIALSVGSSTVTCTATDAVMRNPLACASRRSASDQLRGEMVELGLDGGDALELHVERSLHVCAQVFQT
jgi:hypothetical protein